MADDGDGNNDDDDATGKSLFAPKLVSRMSCTVSTCVCLKKQCFLLPQLWALCVCVKAEEIACC